MKITIGSKGEIITEGWADEYEANRKRIHALVRMETGNPGFDCKNCGNWYQPEPKEWIFHMLCWDCFAVFDNQKQWGRFVSTRVREDWKYFEDADEWIQHVFDKVHNNQSQIGCFP